MQPSGNRSIWTPYEFISACPPHAVQRCRCRIKGEKMISCCTDCYITDDQTESTCWNVQQYMQLGDMYRNISCCYRKIISNRMVCWRRVTVSHKTAWHDECFIALTSQQFASNDNFGFVKKNTTFLKSVYSCRGTSMKKLLVTLS